MTGPAHDRAQLGAYAIGALDPVEARMVHEHLGGCLDCQREVNELMMIRRALDQVPPEAFLDGPPEDGDLLLRRTLRRVAAEVPAAPRRRMTGVYVAAAVALAVALGGGVLLGRQTVSTSTVAAGPTFTVATIPSNARIAEASNSRTGAAMSVALEPKKGWVWVDATATGLPAGKACALYVISDEGNKVLAGTWMVSAESAKKSRVTGMALVAPDDVKSVVIETMGADAHEVVTVPV